MYIISALNNFYLAIAPRSHGRKRIDTITSKHTHPFTLFYVQ